MPVSATASTVAAFNENETENDNDLRSLPNLTRDDGASRDWLLSMVMDLTMGQQDEIADSSFGVTLMVSGLLVSGQVLSRDEWIASTIEGIAEESRIPAERVQTLWDTMMRSFDDLHEENALSGLHSEPRKFIHLKDVRIHSPNGVLSVPFWRGALDRVDGWNFGIPGRAATS